MGSEIIRSVLTPEIENQNFDQVDTPNVRNPFKLPFIDCRLRLFRVTNCFPYRLKGLVIALRDELLEIWLVGVDDNSTSETDCCESVSFVMAELRHESSNKLADKRLWSSSGNVGSEIVGSAVSIDV